MLTDFHNDCSRIKRTGKSRLQKPLMLIFMTTTWFFFNVKHFQHNTIIWSDMQLWVNCLAKWYIMCQVPLFQFKRNTHSHSDNKCFSRVIIVTHTRGKRGTQSLYSNKLQWCCLRLDKKSFFQPIAMQLLIAKCIPKFTEVKCANTTALSRIYIE